MRILQKLNIKDVRHLCKLLGTSQKVLDKICNNPKRFYSQIKMNVKGKDRLMATPQGELRKISDKLQALLQRLSFPDCVHGGRKGRSYITNAYPHINKPIVIKMDLKNFFPSISHFRVFKTFLEDLGCSTEVSSYLTKLTTLNKQLPQGSPTSTILSALVAKPLSIRLEKLTKNYGLSYTQYVDDITISGSSHIIKLIDKIEKIIKQEGFRINSLKTEVINEAKEQVVTGVRVNAGLDSPNEKIKKTRNEIETIVEETENLEYKLASIKGKINYITGLNKGAGGSLKRRFKKEISVMNRRVVTSNS